MGAKGGRARGKEQEAAKVKVELDADGVPVDIERWSDRRLYEYGSQDSNIAGGVKAVELLAARRREEPQSRYDHGDGRERLLKQLEDLGKRQVESLVDAGRCPTCERPVSRAEAEALMARGGHESYMGWFARITAKADELARGVSGTVAPPPGGGG